MERGSFHRAARISMAALAIAAVIVMAPRLPSATGTLMPTFTQTNLISDIPGQAKITDPNLVNPWGMALGLNGGIWVSDNGSGKAARMAGRCDEPIAPCEHSFSDASAQSICAASPTRR